MPCCFAAQTTYTKLVWCEYWCQPLPGPESPQKFLCCLAAAGRSAPYFLCVMALASSSPAGTHNEPAYRSTVRSLTRMTIARWLHYSSSWDTPTR
jgi:hypothetical protein